MINVYAAILAKLNELETMAYAATPGVWFWEPGGWIEQRDGDREIASPRLYGDGTFIAYWSHATVLRGLQEDRDIMLRHSPGGTTTGGDQICVAHGSLMLYHRCPEIRSLARRHGVELDK